MLKRMFIIHGWGGHTEDGWYPWLKRELEKKGFAVDVPAMPNTEEPRIGEWVPFLEKRVGEVNEETYFVGHSIGCQTILRFLERLSGGKVVGRVVLVAPWTRLKPETFEEEGAEEIAKPWTDTPIDWGRVKGHAKFTAIFSDNDAYVPLEEREVFKEKLKARIITLHEKGHINGDDRIMILPEALEAVVSD